MLLKRILILLLVLLVGVVNYSCAKKPTKPRPIEYTLNLIVDYYGGATSVDENAISIKVYNKKEGVGSDNVVAEYGVKDFLDLDKPVRIKSGLEVLVSITLEDDTIKSYMTEENIYIFGEPSTENNFIMASNKSLLIVFSDSEINDIEYIITAGRGGDVDFAMTRQYLVLKAFQIPFNTSKKTTISQYFIDSAEYKIQLEAIPTATEFYTYTFANWTGGSTETTYEITSISPTSISAAFTYVDPTQGGIEAEEPTKNETHYGASWIMVSKPAHLLWIADAVTSGNNKGKYMLEDDIDYEGGYHKSIGAYSPYKFSGVINGNNKSIKNAKFGGLSKDGLFTSFIGGMSGNGTTEGVISNLTIDKSVIINVSSPYANSIVGNFYSGFILNCVNKADINSYGGTYVGGVVGAKNLNGLVVVSNVYNSGNIYVESAGSVFIGGVFGWHRSSNVELVNVYNTGNITYKGTATLVRIGGVMGHAHENAKLLNTYSIGSITTTSNLDYVGGIIGNSINTITLTLLNNYFVGNSDLLDSGFGSLSGITIGLDGRVDSLAGFEDTFNSVAGMAGIWEAGPNARPVIKGLPAE